MGKTAFRDSDYSLKVFKIVRIIIHPTILGLKVESSIMNKFY